MRYLALLAPPGRSDRWLWAAVAGLVLLGLAMVHSASLGPEPHPRLSAAAARQLVYAVVGVVGMLALARQDYRALRGPAPLVFAAGAAVLALVLVFGTAEFGARRWFALGPISIQPSEFAKLVLTITVAAYAAGRRATAVPLGAAFAMLAVLAVLVMLEPDLGTTLVLVAGWIGVLVAWGISWRVLGTLAGSGVALGPLAFALAVSDYQRERLAVFFDPGHDPLGSGYNLQQAEVALHAGGLTGRGLFGGAESHLAGVAARSSDFIFALVGEELGLLGALTVLALVGIVAWRGLETARTAPDGFGRLLAAGLTVTIVSQALLNAAVSIRLFPATGIPMPFVSQGGSALVTMLLAVGLLQSIAAHRPASARERWTGERWG